MLLKNGHGADAALPMQSRAAIKGVVRHACGRAGSYLKLQGPSGWRSVVDERAASELVQPTMPSHDTRIRKDRFQLH